MKKQKSMLLVFILLLGAFLAGCSGGAGGSNSDVTTITVYSVAGADEYYKDILIPMFEEEMDGKYEVEYARGTPHEIINKIKAQGDKGNIDIVATGLDGLPLGIEEDVWEQLIPQYQEETYADDLNEMAQAYVEAYDGYGVPNSTNPGGPVFMYNKDNVEEPPTNFEDLKIWIGENPNKFAYAGLASSAPSRGTVFGVAQSLGEDIENGMELTETWEYLEDIDENISMYPSASSDVFNLLYDGTADIVPHMPMWYAYSTTLGQIPDNIGMVKMEDAKQLIDTQFFVMLKDLPEDRKQASLDFIEFAMSEKAQAQGYITGRVPANAQATPDQILPEYQETYEEILDALPEEFKDDKNVIVPEDDWVLFPETEILNEYYKEWEEKIQAKK